MFTIFMGLYSFKYFLFIRRVVNNTRCNMMEIVSNSISSKLFFNPPPGGFIGFFSGQYSLGGHCLLYPRKPS